MTAEPPLPGGQSTPSEGDSPVSDEVWQRFLEDTEGAIRSSAPKEPSARARVLAERFRREDEASKVRKRRFKKAARPEAWRASPSNVIPLRRSRKLPNWARNALAALLAAGLAAVALNPSGVLSWVRGKPAGSSAAPTVPQTAAPTASTAAEAPDADPFAGSPAQKWANGADGIVLPDAQPVGGLSRSQVAAALGDVKRYLVATGVDPDTLRGQRPQAAFDLLDPSETKVRDTMDAALAAPSKAQNPLEFFSRYNPRQLRLVGSAVRTHGLMTFKEGQYGSLEVHADYTFVYPFAKSGGSAQQVARSIVRRTLEFRVVADGSRWAITPGRLWVYDQATDTANVGCDVYDGFMHPQFAQDMPSQAPTGPAEDPYDASKPIDTSHPDVCGTVTRT